MVRHWLPPFGWETPALCAKSLETFAARAIRGESGGCTVAA
jgi:hypothetical protein